MVVAGRHRRSRQRPATSRDLGAIPRRIRHDRQAPREEEPLLGLKTEVSRLRCRTQSAADTTASAQRFRIPLGFLP
jgi:hypothetical protein